MLNRIKIGEDGVEVETKLDDSEKSVVNEALYYAVRENLNQKPDDSKTDKLRKALNIFKEQETMPRTNYVCNRALDDFFSSCVRRGWEKELEEISWLNLG
ncbi:MAG: hypothetical protein ACOC4Y_01910 [bacterium]